MNIFAPPPPPSIFCGWPGSINNYLQDLYLSNSQFCQHALTRVQDLEKKQQYVLQLETCWKVHKGRKGVHTILLSQASNILYNVHMQTRIQGGGKGGNTPPWGSQGGGNTPPWASAPNGNSAFPKALGKAFILIVHRHVFMESWILEQKVICFLFWLHSFSFLENCFKLQSKKALLQSKGLDST